MLNVKDLEASTKFYTEVPGFEISVQRPTGTFLSCGMIHHDLALFQAPEDALEVTKGQIGLNHLAVQVEDLAALQQTYQSLQDHGAILDHNTNHGMTSSVYFYDPDGIRIEYYCDNCPTDAQGLELMRSPGRKNKELVLG